MALVAGLGCSSSSRETRGEDGKRDASPLDARDRDGAATADVPLPADGAAIVLDADHAIDGTAGRDAPLTIDAASSIDGNNDVVRGETSVVPGGAVLVVDTSAVNIGVLTPGSSASAAISLTNVGRGPSGAVSISATAGLTVHGCGGSLATGATCILTVTVKAPQRGAFSGSLWITADPGAVEPLAISVSATVEGTALFAVSPAALNLGSLAVGGVSPPVTITVTALVALADLNVAVVGEDLAIDDATTCTSALAAQASCSVVVKLTAHAVGASYGSVVINAGGTSGMTATVPITAQVDTGQRLTISPINATFSTSQGVPSPALTFSVRNGGAATSGPLSVTVIGSNASDFVVGGTCSAPLAAGASCSVTVVFNPAQGSSTADRVASLIVTDMGTSGAMTSAGLKGTVLTMTSLVLTPAKSDIGSVMLGATGPATTFTLFNAGSISTGILAVTLSNDEFLLTSDNCSGASLNTGRSCSIAVAFKPVNLGAESTVLTVSGEHVIAVVKTLTGVGIDVVGPNFNPTALDFGSVPVGTSSAPRSASITNYGGAPSGDWVLTSAGNSAAFPIASNTCAGPLAPGATCSLEIQFAPTIAGTQTASFNISDGTVSATLPVAGTGVP